MVVIPVDQKQVVKHSPPTTADVQSRSSALSSVFWCCFEPQQVIFTAPTCLNSLNCCHVIGLSATRVNEPLPIWPNKAAGGSRCLWGELPLRYRARKVSARTVPSHQPWSWNALSRTSGPNIQRTTGDPTTSACSVHRRAAARMSVCTFVYVCVCVFVSTTCLSGQLTLRKDWGRWVEQVQLGIRGRLLWGAAFYRLGTALLTLLLLFCPFPKIIPSAGLMNQVPCPSVGFAFNTIQAFPPFFLCECVRAISIIIPPIAREPLSSSYAWHNHKYSTTTHTHTHTNWLCN